MSIIEKEMKYTEKIRAQRNERAMLEKCKLEAQTQAMIDKEMKMQAVLKLQ